MPELSSLTRQKLVQVDIDLGDGDSVAVVFDRNRITPAWANAAGKRDEQQDPLSMPRALADVIVSWDVTNDGAPFPPTAENLAVLTYAAQANLIERVMQAAVPSDAEGKASSAPSPTPSSDSAEIQHPNGHLTSTSAAPSASPSLT